MPSPAENAMRHTASEPVRLANDSVQFLHARLELLPGCSGIIARTGAASSSLLHIVRSRCRWVADRTAHSVRRLGAQPAGLEDDAALVLDACPELPPGGFRVLPGACPTQPSPALHRVR